MSSAPSPPAPPARTRTRLALGMALRRLLEEYLLPPGGLDEYDGAAISDTVDTIRVLANTVLFLLDAPAPQARLTSWLNQIVAGGASAAAPTTAALDSLLSGAAHKHF